MTGIVREIYVHPVKGLTPSALKEATLEPGVGIPGDRAFALLFADGGVDAADRCVPFTKKHVLAVQNDWPALAALASRYDPQTRRLTVRDGDRTVLDAALDDEAGCRAVDAFFTAYLQRHAPTKVARHPAATPVRVVGTPDGRTRFPDRAPFDVSLLNLASLRELGRAVGAELDVRRFRGNIVVDGLEPWQELDLVDRTLTIGACAIEVKAPITRCINTSVHPVEGRLDLDVLGAVGRSRGKGAFGVVATVRRGGRIAIGDRVAGDCG